MFNERKVAQMGAYFLSLCDGNKMPHLKLMKLLYLSDRQSMDNYGFPISGDQAVAMPHGPVLTMTLDCINGAATLKKDGWKSLISDKSNYRVSLHHDVTLNFDELSSADIGVLDGIWAKFSHMNQWEIVKYTHDHCHEWKDPQGGSVSIPFRKIFKALGKSSKDSLAMETRIKEESAMNRCFATL